MICDTCAVEMNDTTTELEVPARKRLVRAVNVPAFACPGCGQITVEPLVEKVARKAAKRCKDAEFDFPEGTVMLGVTADLKLKRSPEGDKSRDAAEPPEE